MQPDLKEVGKGGRACNAQRDLPPARKHEAPLRIALATIALLFDRRCKARVPPSKQSRVHYANLEQPMGDRIVIRKTHVWRAKPASTRHCGRHDPPNVLRYVLFRPACGADIVQKRSRKRFFFPFFLFFLCPQFFMKVD